MAARWVLVFILGIFLSCRAEWSMAQVIEVPGAASLRGVVTDPDGALVVQATVALVGDGSQAERIAMVDSRGRFGFVNLGVGRYLVRVTAPGFSVFESAEIRLTAQARHEIEIRLEIAPREENLEVSDEAGPDVDPNRNGDALVLRGANIDALPMDSEELLQELKGLVGSDSPDIYVDGFSGSKLPPKETIREIRINENPYSARNDTNPGNGKIEVLTKPGSDKLHGSFYVQGNHSNLNAQNPFVSGQPPYHSWLMNGTLSGALNKRTSYFMNGDSLDNQTNALVNAVVLDGGLNPVNFSQALPSPVTNLNFSTRVDVQPGTKRTLSVRYTINRSHQTNGGIGQFALASQGYENLTTSQTFQLSRARMVSASIMNETRLQYVRTRTNQTPNSFEPALVVQGAFTGGGNNLGAFRDNQDRYEVQDSMAFQAARHYLNFGVRVRVARDANRSSADYNGEFVFSSLTVYQKTLQGLANGLSNAQIEGIGGGPSQFNLTAGTPKIEIAVTDTAAFLQDDWKLKPRLMLSYGIRFEAQDHISDHADWAPRLGLSWGVGGKKNRPANFTLRVGSGLFYQRLALTNVLTAQRQNGVTQQEYVVADPQFYPNAPDMTSLGVQVAPTAYQISPTFHAPYVWNSSIGLDRQLGKHGNVSVTYNYNRGVHILLTRNINAPLLGSGIRPFGGTQNLYQYESTGVWRQSRLATNFFVHAGKHFNFFGSYTLRFDTTDANGGGFVSNQYDIGADFGRSLGDIRHSLVMGGNNPLPYGVHFYSYVRASSGAPFDIVSGQDLNGDSIFNDRPTFATDLTRPSVHATPWGVFDASPVAGQKTIPRNYGEGPGVLACNVGLGKGFSFGPQVKASLRPGAEKSGGKPDLKYHLEIGLDTQNVLNHRNLASPVGTLTSSLFGKSTALATGSSSSVANRMINLYTFVRF